MIQLKPTQGGCWQLFVCCDRCGLPAPSVNVSTKYPHTQALGIYLAEAIMEDDYRVTPTSDVDNLEQYQYFFDREFTSIHCPECATNPETAPTTLDRLIAALDLIRVQDEQLRAEYDSNKETEEALKKIVGRSDAGINGTYGTDCIYCEGGFDPSETVFAHSPDCPIYRAKARLGLDTD